MKGVESDLIFTAETHNMPTAVAPLSGATIQGRVVVFVMCTDGREGHTIAGTADY